MQHSNIYMVESQFGNFTKNFIYKDKKRNAEVLNFGVDNTRKRLIILTGIKNQKNRRDKFVTIYDIDTEQTLYQLQVHDREIIGRLKSNLYNFVEGHIYYGNKVIKVRYDLIEKNKGENIPENQFFDHYSDIISLKYPEYYIQSGTPLQNCMYNKLAYIVRNIKRANPRTLMVLPYLHDRKIYLNRRHTTN